MVLRIPLDLVIVLIEHSIITFSVQWSSVRVNSSEGCIWRRVGGSLLLVMMIVMVDVSVGIMDSNWRI